MAFPSSLTLKQLDRLDQSSFNFPLQLGNILNGQEYAECKPALTGEELIWFVDYLDKVPESFDPSSAISRKCLSELRMLCRSRTVLPTSHVFSPGTLQVSYDSFASGQYGDVYEASLDRSRVRVKRLRVPHQRDTQAAQEAFCEVAITLKRLKHQNIVHLLGFTITPLQLISDWMPNGNLPDYLEKNPGADIVVLLSDVANGIYYLHSYDIILREIKGSNVLVDADHHARVADFGLAVITTDGNMPTDPSRPQYNPRWMAPEALKGGDHSKAADIFSFAMLMIEVFDGTIPFGNLSGFGAALAIVQGKRPLRPIHPAVTEPLWGFIKRCWDENPALRPEAAEVSQILHAEICRRETGLNL